MQALQNQGRSDLPLIALYTVFVVPRYETHLWWPLYSHDYPRAYHFHQQIETQMCHSSTFLHLTANGSVPLYFCSCSPYPWMLKRKNLPCLVLHSHGRRHLVSCLLLCKQIFTFLFRHSWASLHKKFLWHLNA